MRKTRSSILDAVHKTARGFHDAGVMDKVTMREFDRLCLPPVEQLQPQEIRQIREKAGVSQAGIAALLNTSLSTVWKWKSVRSIQPAQLSSCCIWYRKKDWKLLLDPVAAENT